MCTRVLTRNDSLEVTADAGRNGAHLFPRSCKRVRSSSITSRRKERELVSRCRVTNRFAAALYNPAGLCGDFDYCTACLGVTEIVVHKSFYQSAADSFFFFSFSQQEFVRKFSLKFTWSNEQDYSAISQRNLRRARFCKENKIIPRLAKALAASEKKHLPVSMRNAGISRLFLHGNG